MTRYIRFLVSAVAAIAFASGHSAFAQGATVTFNDPNCASWSMTQNGSSFTLTCQALNCSIAASPASPLPTDAVTLTANCAGSTANTAYSWSKTSGPLACPAPPASGNPAALAAAGATTTGCVYRVAATDPVTGSGAATVTVNWTTTPPASPSGCSITPNPSSLPSAGGSVTLTAVCTGNTNANTTWQFTKGGANFGNVSTGASGTSSSDSLPANTGTAATTTTYGMVVTNAGAPATTVTSTVTVAGTGGGGGSFDLSACTAAGYTGRGVDIPYPLTANSPRVFTPNLGNFGANEMIVVRFVAPAVETTPGASIVASEYSSYAPAFRLATLSTRPCEVAPSTATTATILGSTISQAPNFSMALTGTGGFSYPIKLIPGATYYVNYVNRQAYGSSVDSCGTGNCAMYIDFKN